MKMSIDKVVKETNRLKLLCLDWYLAALNTRPYLIDKIANGVGSETSWTYHLTPDTNWGLNINPTSHVHDCMYTFPLKFASVGEGLAWKRLADYWFEINCKKQIEDYGGWFKSYRLSRLDKYMIALEIGGSEAFWVNKLLPPDFDKYYAKTPINDPSTFELYKNTWKEICNL